MKRLELRALSIVAVLFAMLSHDALAKAVTVKLMTTGAWRQRPLEITSPRALVNVWSGTRAATSLFDFPEPFIYLPGHTEPDANWAMIRPGGGKWNLAPEEWSAVINSQLAAASR